MTTQPPPLQPSAKTPKARHRPNRYPLVVGEPAADRLMRALDYRPHPEARRLTRDEVAVVLHALADHTAIMAALDYARPVDGFWPDATSLGRWFHDTADQLEDDPSPSSDSADNAHTDGAR